MSAATQARGKGFMVPADLDLGSEIDWRSIFIRYVDVVRESEGVDFLYEEDGDDDNPTRTWTAAEWAAIRQAVNR